MRTSSVMELKVASAIQFIYHHLFNGTSASTATFTCRKSLRYYNKKNVQLFNSVSYNNYSM